MAKNLTIILLLSSLSLASLRTANAVEYTVTNNARNLPGGQAFKKLIGASWTIDLMGTINQFIWNLFEQTDDASRKSVPVLNLYISDFDFAAGMTSGNNINISQSDFSDWSPKDIKWQFSSIMYHEMTHIFQWSGNGTAPGGLTEGVADYVRIKSGFYDPNGFTKPGEGKKWDDGYGTTARFLEYCDSLKPKFTIMLNNKMRKVYKDSYFQDLLGKPLPQVWNEYKAKYGNTPAHSDSDILV